MSWGLHAVSANGDWNELYRFLKNQTISDKNQTRKKILPTDQLHYKDFLDFTVVFINFSHEHKYLLDYSA